jgi:hypothetical protein
MIIPDTIVFIGSSLLKAKRQRSASASSSSWRSLPREFFGGGERESDHDLLSCWPGIQHIGFGRSSALPIELATDSYCDFVCHAVRATTERSSIDA